MKVNRPFVLALYGLMLFLILFLLFFNHPQTRYIINTTKRKLQSAFFLQTDYTYLVNMNFTFKMLPLVCNEDEGLLLILVHSATDHFSQRKTIRETWGQSDDDIKLLFLVGTVENAAIQEKIQEENKAHNDIMQGSFLDTYHNLTYKHVMALKYVVYHCPRTQFVLKVDDDVFVNVPTLKNFLGSYICQNGKRTKILCSRLKNPPVLREGKWATSLEEYPEDNYPTHCGGFAIIYPRDVILSLYTEAQRTRFFWVDDVFVSGICAKKSNITHIGIERLILSNTDVHSIVDLSFTNVTKPFLIGTINLSENRIRSLWNFVTHHRPKTIMEYLVYN